jgi:hypothetical protein
LSIPGGTVIGVSGGITTGKPGQTGSWTGNTGEIGVPGGMTIGFPNVDRMRRVDRPAGWQIDRWFNAVAAANAEAWIDRAAFANGHNHCEIRSHCFIPSIVGFRVASVAPEK